MHTKKVRCFIRVFLMVSAVYFMLSGIEIKNFWCMAASAQFVEIFDYSTDKVKVLNENDSRLSINGEDVASYDSAGSTLTLNNYKCDTLPANYSALTIYLDENQTFTVNVSGENLIENVPVNAEEIKDGIRIEGAGSGTVKFTGSGKLNVKIAKTDLYTSAVYAYGNLEISGPQMELTSYGCGIHSRSNLLICGESNITLNAMSDENSEYLADGIYVVKNLTISENAKVYATGYDTGIYTCEGSINILNNSEVDAKSTAEVHGADDEYAICGILCDNNIAVKDNAKVSVHALDCGILAGENPDNPKSELIISNNAVVIAEAKNYFAAASYGSLKILDNAKVTARISGEDNNITDSDICALQAIKDLIIEGRAEVYAFGITYGIASKDGRILISGGNITSKAAAETGRSFSKEPIISVLDANVQVLAGDGENTASEVEINDLYFESQWSKITISEKSEWEKCLYLMRDYKFWVVLIITLALILILIFIFKKFRRKRC